jgi:hypothetical protein
LNLASEAPVTHLSIPALLVLLLAAPLPALAATHKCIVIGQTVYQQAPCAADAQGEVMKLPSGNSAGGQTYSGSEVAKLRKEVIDKGTPLARDAFERMAAGKVDVYVANLCARERELWSKPTLMSSLTAMGKILASDRMKIGRQTDATMDSLSFIAVQEPGPVAHDSSVKPRMRTVRAHFGRDMGQLCLRTLDIGA